MCGMRYLDFCDRQHIRNGKKEIHKNIYHFFPGTETDHPSPEDSASTSCCLVLRLRLCLQSASTAVVLHKTLVFLSKLPQYPLCPSPVMDNIYSSVIVPRLVSDKSPTVSLCVCVCAFARLPGVGAGATVLNEYKNNTRIIYHLAYCPALRLA